MADDQDEILRLRKRVHDLADEVNVSKLQNATIDTKVTDLVADVKELKDDSKLFMRESRETLRAIETQTSKFDSRMAVLEKTAEGHGRELGRLNSAVFPRPQNTAVAPVESGEFIGFRISSKIWAAIAAGGGVLFAMGVDTIKHWWNR